MSLKIPTVDPPLGADNTSSYCGVSSTDMRSSEAAIRTTNISASVPNSVVGSHPGLLALARILGRSAARADLRRIRNGAVAIMRMTDAMLVVAAIIAFTLVWHVILRLH